MAEHRHTWAQFHGGREGSFLPLPSLDTDAQETVERPSAHIIMLGGAIKWWWQATCMTCGHWDEPHLIRHQRCPAVGHTRNHDLYVWWDSIEHRTYVRWRARVRAALIDAGYLTYAPWMAFKGTWDERAQVVNDAVLSVSTALVVLSPSYAITEGTDTERTLAEEMGIPIIDCPPDDERDAMGRTGIDTLLATLGSVVHSSTRRTI